MTGNNRAGKVFLPIILVSLCVFIIGIIWAIDRIPEWAAKNFGSPDPKLSFLDELQYSIRLFVDQNDLLQPVQAFSIPTSFRIEIGESVSSISERLQSTGIIRSASSFRLYLIYSGLDVKIQAGDYFLDPSLNCVQIVQNLLDATPSAISFTIFPGWRIEEIAKALPTSGLEFSPDNFIEISKSPIGITFPANIPKNSSLEGFLFPNTYRFSRKIEIEDFLLEIVKNFDKHLSGDISNAYQNQGLSILSAVTLASIVQREAVLPEEQPIIASVFLNRLALGMKLESDPTVQYARGFNEMQNTWWTNPLSAGDLTIDSLYNTYANTGLPPAPISNPGLAALKAVAYPEQTQYLYFRAMCDGSGRHFFSFTYEEHLANACQ